MTEIVVCKYSAHCFSLEFESECLQRRKKSLSVFVLASKTKEDYKIVLPPKLAESDKGSYYNQEKWLKDDKAPEKPIETTAESSFTNSLARGASFLGREAAKKKKWMKYCFESLLWRERSFKKCPVVDFSREVSNF